MGGVFSRLGSKEIRNVARWDGEEWQSLGAGPRSHVFGLAVWKRKLIAIGHGFLAGSDENQALVAWDGSSWKPLGLRLRTATAVTVWRDQLVVAGCIVEWKETVSVLKGADWTPMGELPADVGAVSLASVGDDLFLGTRNSGVLRWTGSDWVVEPVGVPGHVSEMLLVQGGLLAIAIEQQTVPPRRWTQRMVIREPSGQWRELSIVGEEERVHFIGRWRGQAVMLRNQESLELISGSSVTPFPLPPGFERSCEALEMDGRLWVLAEGSAGPGLKQTTQLLAWDGVKWSAPAAGGLAPSGPVAALLSDGDRLLVAGAFDAVGIVPTQRAASWDGAAWTPMQGTTNDRADTTVCHPISIDGLLVHDGSLLAAGWMSSDGKARSHPRCLARWDGSKWRWWGGEPSTKSGGWGSVTAQSIVETPWGLVVGGAFNCIDDVVLDGIGSWNGTVWSALGSETGRSPSSKHPFSSRFDPVIRFGDGIVARGEFFDGSQFHSLGYWNGSEWSFLDYGLDRPAAAVMAWDDRVVVGGSFEHVGGLEAKHIAAWNGTSWAALGDGLPDPVTMLGLYHRQLLAVTSHSHRGAKPRWRLWRWTGEDWNPFAGRTEFDGEVRELCEHRGELYVGGAFWNVNEIPSANLARWIPDGSTIK